jgi:hypothetical protein
MALEITPEIFRKLINRDTDLPGGEVKVNGVYLRIPENSELELIDIIEQKLVKDYGLDVEEEEEK